MQVQRKRIAALLMAGAMLFSTLPVNALAVENPDTGGLCEHHPEHTEDCYALVENCIHEHGPECYPADSVSDNTATPSDGEDREPTECTHVCSEESGCIKKELNCQHEHSDECGYAPATEGTPCGFVCEECNAEPGEQKKDACICDAPCTEEAVNTDCPVCGMDGADLATCEGGAEPEEESCTCKTLCIEENVNADCPVCGADGADLAACKGEAEPAQVQHITVTGFDELPEEVAAQIVPAKTKLADLNLPDTLGASGYVGTQDSSGAEPHTIEGVEWEPDPSYDENAEQGAWLFTAKLPEGYALLDGVELPQIGVMAEPVNLLAEGTGDFTVEGGQAGTDYSYADNTLTILSDTPLTISGATKQDKIVIQDGITANVTINNLYIQSSNCAFEVAGNATCNLTLEGENTLKSGHSCAGLQVQGNRDGSTVATLTITENSTGSLSAAGGDYAAGIGSAGSYTYSGNITIQGGVITAKGGSWCGPGIGGDFGANVTITGGMVTAIGGDHMKGIGSNAGNTFSTGANGNAIIVANSIGQGDSEDKTDWRGIFFVGDEAGKIHGGSITLTSNGEIPAGKLLKVESGETISIEQGATLTNNGVMHVEGTISGSFVNNGTIYLIDSATLPDGVGGTIINVSTAPSGLIVEGGTKGVDYTYENNVLTVKTKTGLRIVAPIKTTVDKVVIDSACTGDNAAKIILDNVNIDLSGTDNACAFEVQNGAVCNLTLAGASTLKSGKNKAGLQVETGAELIITAGSTGKLTANGGSDGGAGIGGGNKGSGGAITIKGGTVSANGRHGGAGIGGGLEGAGGTIVIEGNAVVTASGNDEGAGIGHGRSGGDTIITIKGNASVEAYGSEFYGKSGDAIVGDITLGGNAIVTATGRYYSGNDYYASAIGGKLSSEEGNHAQLFSNGFNQNILTENFTSGLIFTNDTEVYVNGKIVVGDGASCLVYGDQSITENVELQQGGKMVVYENGTLTVPSGVTLTNNGSITGNTDDTGGTLTDGGGTLTGTGTVADTITNGFQKASEVKITFAPTQPLYGNTISIKAEVSKAQTNALTRDVKQNEVEFFIGTDGNKQSLGTAAMTGNTATLQNVTITLENGWKAGDNTITAEYGGSMGLHPKTDSTILNVDCDHDYNTNKDEDHDCTTPIMCSICGKATTVAPNSHSVVSWENKHNKKHNGYCTISDCTQSVTENCDRNGTDGVCSKCGYKWIVISEQPADQTVNMGQSAAFSVTATGDGESTYQWEYSTNDGTSWTKIDGAKSATYEVKTAKLDMNGYQYHCIVSNNGDSVTSNNVILTVNEVKEGEPKIGIDYKKEILTDFDANGSYEIDGMEVTPTNGALAVAGYMGKTISIVKQGDGINKNDSTPQSLTIPARPTTQPDVDINYEAETLTTATDMEYRIGTGAWNSCGANMDVNDEVFGWGGSAAVEVHFRTAATKDKFASVEKMVKIKARPAAPTSLQGENTSFAGESDGKITGVSSKMEWQKDGVSGWTACDGTEITNLDPGTYYVRLKATVGEFASAGAKVEIASGEERTYTLNITPPTFDNVAYGYTQPEAKAITISSTGNSDSTISQVALSGANASSFILNKSDGTTISAGGTDNTTYTIHPGAGLNAGKYEATITVTYKGDQEYKAAAQVSFTVTPAEQAAPDKAPELADNSRNSIILKAVEPNGNGAKAEYSRDGGASWQASPEFTGLSSGTKYSFVVRYGATADGNYAPSPASPPAEYSTTRPSSGGGSSSGGGGGSSTITDRPDKNDPDSPTTGQTKPVKPDKGGSVSIGGGDVQDAIDKATADAKKNGNQANGIAITVPVNNAADAEGLTITIPAATLDKLVTAKVRRFDITTNGLPCFSFTLDTLKMLDSQSQGGDLILRLTKTAVTSAEAKAAIGTRPAYDITLVWVKNGKETPLTDWQGKTISVKLPYTPAKGEQAGNLYAVYVDGNGKVEWLTKSSYDADQKAVLFEATHFSVYGVGYKLPAPVFTDISGHWAEEHILFVVSRGLLNGTGNNQFSPNTGMTRGMFVTALGRLAGIDPASYQSGRFTDVKTDAYYAPYVNWAAQTGIVNGTSATTFSPDTNVTREQMAVMMANYADKLGYELPATLEAVTFADNGKISTWSAEAVKAMQQAGILAGKDGNRFDPQGTATRAEVATVLHRFVEIVIDPQAANGWTENASGTRSYYKGGKTAIGWLYDDKWYWLQNGGIPFAGGWKQIGGKWYFFNPDGTMAVNTTIDGYTIGPDGARK